MSGMMFCFIRFVFTVSGLVAGFFPSPFRGRRLCWCAKPPEPRSRRVGDVSVLRKNIFHREPSVLVDSRGTKSFTLSRARRDALVPPR